MTPAAADELIVDAWALRDNLTVADAVYVVLARRSGAALMSTDERMLRAPGLDDIPLPSALTHTQRKTRAPRPSGTGLGFTS